MQPRSCAFVWQLNCTQTLLSIAVKGTHMLLKLDPVLSTCGSGNTLSDSRVLIHFLSIIYPEEIQHPGLYLWIGTVEVPVYTTCFFQPFPGNPLVTASTTLNVRRLRVFSVCFSALSGLFTTRKA